MVDLHLREPAAMSVTFIVDKGGNFAEVARLRTPSFFQKARASERRTLFEGSGGRRGTASTSSPPLGAPAS